MHFEAQANNGSIKSRHASTRSMACAGGVDVLLGSLKPTINEKLMVELIARCCQHRCELTARTDCVERSFVSGAWLFE